MLIYLYFFNNLYFLNKNMLVSIINKDQTSKKETLIEIMCILNL
jgi:hypothetical protein